MYKLTNGTSIIRLSDNACIPIDTRNADYLEYLDWLALGNTPQPKELPTPPELKLLKQSEIDALEASQYMTRGEREGWLAMIEAQAVTQNVSLETLYSTNLFYKKLRDVNDQITTLRTELKEIT